MSRAKLGLRLAVPALVLVAAGAGSYSYLSAGPDTPTVSTATVGRGDVVQAIAATGTLQAVTTVDVGTQVSGTVKALLVDFNDTVRKGQVLARLDPSLLQAQVEQAEANLIKAEADVKQTRVALEDAKTKLTRAKLLSERQLIAVTDLDAATLSVRTIEAQLESADAQVRQAQASLNQAKVNVDHTVITSPIDGIVITRSVNVGQTVAASMSTPTLYVLAADLTRMRVNAKLDESDIAEVRKGLAVSFRVDAYPAETFTGRVEQVRLQGETSSNVVTYTTVIDVPNPELKLKPGMTANVSVQVARHDNVLKVASAALRFRPTTEQLARLHATRPGTPQAGSGTAPGSPKGSAPAAPGAAPAVRGKSTTVWRSTATGAEPVSVVTGISDGTSTEIVSGDLRAGDRLVTTIAATSASSAKSTAKTTQSNPLMGPSMPPGPPPGGPGPR